MRGFGPMVLAVVAAAGLVAAPPAGAAPGGGTGDGRFSAVVRRTEFGIPHVLASDFGGLGYGYGYAFAQDNLCALETSVLTAGGGRSAVFGPAADSGDALAAQPVSNLDSDVYYRAVANDERIGRLVAQPAPLGPSADARRLVSGYVAGVNRFLRDTGAARLTDPSCRAQPWVRPITDLDVYRLMYGFSQFGGTDAVKPLIANAAPGAAARLDAPAPPPAGSNAISVGRAGTKSGDGVLLANPHFPWVGAQRFYQVQLTIPGRMDVSGASLYGSPLVEIGHTRHLAWSHTVSTAQRFTLYQLALTPGDPTTYTVDGRPEAMTRQTVTVPVGGGAEVTRTLYSSRYGPMIASGWTAASALSIKGASADNMRSLDEWLAMDQSDSVAKLRAAQDRYQGIPFVNTIAADSTGVSYTADASVVPHVTDELAARCVDSPLGQAQYPAQTVLDGARSDCAWGSDPDAVEPGIFGPRTNPALTREDFTTNSNDSTWLTNPAQPLSYPRIYGDTGTPRSLRTRLGLQQISERLQGTDGLGPARFDLTTMQQLWYGDRNYSAEQARDAVVALCRANPRLTTADGRTVDVGAACPVLAAWDLRGDPDSRGSLLWRQFWTGAARASDLWSVPFDPQHPATTPATLNQSSPVVRQALAAAVAKLTGLGVALDAPLSAAQRTTVGGPAVPVPGCSGAEGCYNVVGKGEPLGADGRFPPVVFGSSFVMATELTPDGPRTSTLLTYSQSSDPTSAHHNDQTELFSHKQWVTDRYTEAQICASPRLRVSVLNGR
ncbi:penicillin acylase family protein [Amycolatopsis sp. PS_44_ISF1]|uniref:penicillin acylase family protein n=1 Tax=Amycolatopsis sp. PS_44_ISF1 TaxID=2974917 RepID=UPI0028DD7092|nr:penicillin acylase family protein [Amycolatopsis sp. PS_44_ISF1]MDT8911957.1 penicillin acylase family protein [Amycolatopsis sp. PS_44_ISF1]